MKITTRPFFTMFQHLCNMIFLLLFVLPGSAAWSPEEYFHSTGTLYGPNTVDKLSIQQRAVSTDFISQEKLQEFAVQMNNSWDRLGGIDHSTVTDDQFLTEADLIFRIYKGIYSNKSVPQEAVLLNGRDYVYDYEVRPTTLSQYFNDSNNSVIRVQGFFRRREALVGKRHVAPVMLIAAEVCVIFSSLIVFGNILRLLWNRLKTFQDRMCTRIKKFIFNGNETSVDEGDFDVGSRFRRK